MQLCRYKRDPEIISTLITPVGTDIITLAEFKEHAKIADDSEDNVIAIYIDSASRMADNYTGRAILAGAWKSTLDYFPYSLKIPVLPIDASSIVVKYFDVDNAEQTLADTEYRVYDRGANEYTEIIFTGTIPNTFDKVGAVSIEYDAGYTVIPGPIKNEVLSYATAKYENRQNEQGGSSSLLEIGFYQALFPYRLL